MPATVQLAVAINMGTNLPSCATPNGECSAEGATKQRFVCLHARALWQTVALAVLTSTPSLICMAWICVGQAAFLFVLTSSIAPLVNLTYGKMVYMAAPYTIMLALSGFFGTVYMYDNW